MENALLIGLSRQVALGRELDVIANNMANVTTNGFKARSSRFREYLMPVASAEAFPRPDRRLSYVIDAGTPLDIRSGAIEHTGNPLDVAIKGDAFLAVQTPAGERYTRNGALEIDAQGQLVTSDGHTVLGDNGPITFTPQESGFEIAPDGTVTSNQGAARARFASCASTTRRSCTTRAPTSSRRRTAAQPAGATSRLEPRRHRALERQAGGRDEPPHRGQPQPIPASPA